MIKFDSKTQMILSDDLKSDLWALITEERFKNAAVFIDSNVAGQEILQEAIKYLKTKISLSVYSVISKEPTTDLVNEYAALIRNERLDVCIGIGGGSVIDLTKAVSVMAVNRGKVEEYHGTGKIFNAGIKKITVPTTAGTGSEVTPGAVLVNTDTKFKRAISGRYVAPDYAVLNAGLTVTMPDNITASTGLDALGHAIESYTAKCANDITKMYSRQAFSLIFNTLPKIFDDRQDLRLRQKMLLGSCLAGYAIYNSNTGACHSMAYPLGIYNHVPHGFAVGSMLSRVIKFNVEKGCYLYGDLYDLVEDAEKNVGQKIKAEKFVSLLDRYLPISHLGGSFKDYGINSENYEFLSERGLDLVSALNNNPVDFRLEDAKCVLRSLL